MPQPIYKNKLMMVGAATAIIAASFYFFSSTFGKPATLKDPRFKDDIFAEAVVIAAHMRNDPTCIGLGKLIIDNADPRRGSELYRAQIRQRLVERIPAGCIAPDDYPIPVALTAYIESTNPARTGGKQSTNTASSGEDSAAQTMAAPVVQIAPFVVALADTDKPHYLQIAFSVLVSDSSSAEKVKSAMPEIRDRAIKYLGTKRSTEIADTAGKEAMSRDLITSFNQPLSSIGNAVINAKSVFLTSFTIQSE